MVENPSCIAMVLMRYINFECSGSVMFMNDSARLEGDGITAYV